eukprot:9835880-Alexandrium_andersonii.AAC.1
MSNNLRSAHSCLLDNLSLRKLELEHHALPGDTLRNHAVGLARPLMALMALCLLYTSPSPRD